MYELLEYRVCDVMTVDPICVGPTVTLADAAKILDEHDFNGLPVVAPDGECVGFLTKLDVLAAFRSRDGTLFPPYDEIMARPVSDAMAPRAIGVTPRALLTDVLEKMVSTRHKSFPVIDDTRLVGMVSREDVLHGLRRAASGEVAKGPI